MSPSPPPNLTHAVELQGCHGPVPGWIGGPLTSDQKDEISREWPPRIGPDEPDAAWPWATLWSDHPDGDRYRTLGLWAEGRMQGFAVVEAGVGFVSTGLSEPALRPHYVATAPWARATAPRETRLRPVGPLLLLASIAASYAAGHDGRVSWHSEPRTDEWYRRNVPEAASFPEQFDGERHLTLFELDAGAAERYRARSRALGAVTPDRI